MDSAETTITTAVGYDGGSLVIGGHRVWLMSGTIHPFRIPPEEWAARLDVFLDAGLNCVEIYLPWNLLEPVRGHFDWTGVNDYPHFLELCRDRGLYVFLRPGPYICAEWDLGGLPAWLLETGADLRSPDPRFLEPVACYFEEIFRHLGHYQRGVSPDGPIILIQAENEFWMSHPEGLRYLDEVSRLLIAAGACVPLTDCNMLYNNPPTLHTINGGWNYPANFQRMRREFPEQPLLVAEFHCGWFTTTTRQRDHRHLDESGYFLNRLRYLSRGAMTNIYPFAGGTNFGNRGARVAAGEFTTASYDFSAPVTEGGGRSDKYYFARLAHRLESLFSDQLAQSPRPCEAVYVHGHPHAITRQTPAGELVFVFKTIDNPPDDETVPLIMGRWQRLQARFSSLLTVRILPIGYQASPDVFIDYCEAQLFHLRETPTGTELFFYDLPGQTAELSLNGRAGSVTFPLSSRAGPEVITWDDRTQLRLFTHLQALRFQPADTEAGYALESAPGRSRSIHACLSPWRAVGFQPTANAVAPVRIDGFARLGALDAAHEQGIFSFQLTAPARSLTHLYLRDLHDRAHIWVNGHLCGVQGADPAASRQPRPITLEAGTNRIDLLVGNWGHDTACYGQADGKGFAGAPCLVSPILVDWTVAPALTLERTELDFWLASNMVQNAHIDLAATLTLFPRQITLPQVATLHLAIPVQNTPYFVLLNGHLLHASTGRAWFTDLTPGPADTLAVAFTQAVERDIFDFSGIVLASDFVPLPPEQLTFAPLTPPSSEASVPVTANHPAWFSSDFTLSSIPAGGLLLDLGTQSRGRLWLNDRLLARYWHPGPQSLYWAPASWLTTNNSIVLFDEEGSVPPAELPLHTQTHGPFQRYPDIVFPRQDLEDHETNYQP